MAKVNGIVHIEDTHLPPRALSPLPAWMRLYFYGVQGFFYEIMFTSMLDFCMGKTGWELKGHSSVSTFFIYGCCSIFVEQLYMYLYYEKRFRWYMRFPVYVSIVYFWEFTCGSLLRKFNACPWDYSHYPYNFMGLITLEYAPGWIFLSWVQDNLTEFILKMRLIEKPYYGTRPNWPIAKNRPNWPISNGSNHKKM